MHLRNLSASLEVRKAWLREARCAGLLLVSFFDFADLSGRQLYQSAALHFSIIFRFHNNLNMLSFLFLWVSAKSNCCLKFIASADQAGGGDESGEMHSRRFVWDRLPTIFA
jgi:hypothetical protein